MTLSENSSGTAHKVLIICDDQAIQSALPAALMKAKYAVLMAHRALDGLDIARAQQPDLILTDLHLPDMSGNELATTLRGDKRFAETPIVLMCAPQSPDERDLSFAAGISGFIDKPLQIEAVALMLAFFLSGGTHTVPDGDKLQAARSRYFQLVVSRLEERVRALEAQNKSLERIDDMKDTFIQLTAHELRTPLTLITGYSRLLADHPPLLSMMKSDDDIRNLVDGLTESIARMQNIIEDILTTSRIMTNRIELNVRPINLGKIAQRVIDQYAETLTQRELKVNFDARYWPQAMRGDAELLHLTFSNLMGNAIKYTPNKGAITLKAQYTSQLARISIKDNGIGIDPEMKQSIFERMHHSGDVSLHGTSKTAFMGGGLGLGLSICQGIIKAHGGKIWVESSGRDIEKRPGSEFIMVLPLSPQEKAPRMSIQALSMRKNEK